MMVRNFALYRHVLENNNIHNEKHYTRGRNVNPWFKNIHFDLFCKISC